MATSEEISGTKITRCNQITLQNPDNGTPSATFNVVERVTIGEQTFVIGNYAIEDAMGTAPWPILNPADDSNTGQQFTDQELYAILYSRFKFAESKHAP